LDSPLARHLAGQAFWSAKAELVKNRTENVKKSLSYFCFVSVSHLQAASAFLLRALEYPIEGGEGGYALNANRGSFSCKMV